MPLYQYDDLRAAHRANLITWESIVAHHQQAYPRCACGTPTAMTVEGIGPVCHLCVAFHYEAIQKVLRGER